MATERKRAIRSTAGWTANQAAMEAEYGAGNYFTTLSAWEAAEQTNLVTADQIRTAVCYNDWPAGLNDALYIDGWTTDATRYARVTVAPGHRHNGIAESGFWMKKSVDYEGIVNPIQAHSRVEWVQAHNNSTSGFRVTGASTRLVSCIGRGSQEAFACYGASGLYIQCLSLNAARGFRCVDWVTNTLLGCVAVGYWGEGFSSGGGGSVTAKNCVAYSPGYPGFIGSAWSAASTNNATSSATDDAPGGSSVLSVTSAAFVSAAGNNFHLASGSVLIGAGVNLYSDYQTDIDGDTWPGSGAWSIGFDHRASAPVAPAVISVLMSNITTSGARATATWS